MNNFSSSPSSSDSGSEVQSRATTPCSIISAPWNGGIAPLPELYVQLFDVQVQPKVLTALFKNHAVGGTLGIYLPKVATKSATVDRHFDWKTETINVEGETTQYRLGAGALDMGQFEVDMAIESVRASHLALFATASLRSVLSFSAGEGQWVLHILERPTFTFLPLSLTPGFLPTSADRDRLSKTSNVPTLEEWQNLWSVWDLVTLRMIPRSMLHQKPIDLRHKCLFYIGHIPTFLDMLLSKAIGGKPSEPEYFRNIFERGIDPHVDDPNHCHRHSEVPDRDEDWPTLESILTFRDRVRSRLIKLYDELEMGQRPLTRTIARTLVMSIEHEGFHIETLLYMLIQQAGCGTLPPPGFVVPTWTFLAEQWARLPSPSHSTVVLAPETITLGHDDCEADDRLYEKEFDVHGHTFGWDNENPERTMAVGRFRVEWRPITNGEFEKFWTENDNVPMPKSWCWEDGEVQVRTIYGPVPMEIARCWPVLTSYDDLAEYTRSKGGRIPTEPELRLFLDKYEAGYEGGANAGFRHWHPTPATTGLDEYGGRGSNGGVWEWTSTVFDSHEGLSPTNLFTGYSTDFFDTKHQVVLGASYATIPRLASRRTLRNFYQHNYPYAWAGARIIYDM